MVNRIVVGAHYGIKDWLIQRATALLMAITSLIFVVALIICQPSGQIQWHGFIANGYIKFTLCIFFASLCWHAWIGVRDIWMDYVKPTYLRFLLMILTATMLLGYLAWAAQILWRVYK